MKPVPPDDLSPSAREWFQIVVDTYQCDEHQLRLLLQASRAWDRAEQARKILAKEGIVYKDRFGAPRPHPAVAIERNAQIAFLRLLRALNFDNEEIERGPGRPPKGGLGA
jgi:phage terminase small subunit